MEENKFWVSVNGMFTAALVTLILTIGVNSYHNGQRDLARFEALARAKVDAIKGGADPLAVSCAFDGAGQLCAVLVARR
jgi:hypothetical protein